MASFLEWYNVQKLEHVELHNSIKHSIVYFEWIFYLAYEL